MLFIAKETEKVVFETLRKIENRDFSMKKLFKLWLSLLYSIALLWYLFNKLEETPLAKEAQKSLYKTLRAERAAN